MSLLQFLEADMFNTK